MVDFHDVQFPVYLSLGAVGGPRFRTAVAVTRKNLEKRNVEWQDPLHHFNVTPVIEDQAALDDLVAFYRARRGRKYSFRYKDWMDFEVDTFENIGTADNSTTQFLLIKTYSSGYSGDTHSSKRVISKPILSTMIVHVNSLLTSLAYYVTDDGLLTFGRQNIDGVTFTSTVNTIARSTGSWIDDGVVTGNKVEIIGSTNNDGVYTVTGTVTASTITVTTALIDEGPVDDIEARYPPVSGAVEWMGEFDVPVRFDNQSMPIQFDTFQNFEWSGVLLTEERIPIPSGYDPGETVFSEFEETRLPDDLRLGSIFGNRDNTVISFSDSGAEQRDDAFDQEFGTFDVGYDHRLKSEITPLLNFFHSRKGRGVGFRFKDWTDYKATAEVLGTANGSLQTFQLLKSYVSGGYSRTKKIRKPVAGTTTVWVNGVVDSNAIVDTTTGIVDFTLGSIPNITFASPANTITRAAGDWTAAGVQIGTKLNITGTVSNNMTVTVNTVTTTVLTVDEALTGEVVASGATFGIPPLAGPVTASFEYDLPVRFNTDDFNTSVDGYEVYGVTFPLREINLEPAVDVFTVGQTGRNTPGVSLK